MHAVRSAITAAAELLVIIVDGIFRPTLSIDNTTVIVDAQVPGFNFTFTVLKLSQKLML